MSTQKMSNEELVHHIQQGHTELMEVLVLQNINLVRRVAHRLNVPSVDLDDKVQDGVMGMMEAVKTYKLDVGIKFSTHAFRRIRAKILREGNEQANMIRLPANMVELKMKVNKFVREEIATTGIRPSMDEIAYRLQLDIEDVKYVLSGSSAPSSLDATIEGGEGEKMAVMDIVGGDTLDSTIWQDERTKVIVDFLDELPAMEQEIVTEVLGLKTGVSKTARELDKKIKNEAGDLVSYATINIRYNKAIDYIKARIAGEQIIYQTSAPKPRTVKPKKVTKVKDQTKRDVVICISQQTGQAYISAELQFSQEDSSHLLSLMKKHAEASAVANLADAVALNYTPNVAVGDLSTALSDAMEAVSAMGLQLA